MKAAVLKSFGLPLSVEAVPDPVLGTGEVIVAVAATAVLPYTKEVLRGERRYLLTLPVIPGVGAIGRVLAAGPDTTRLRAGDWVLCDPTVRARDDAQTPDITLQGWSARGEGGLRLQEYFHDGPFAEQMRVPTECALPLGPLSSAEEAARWCALTVLLVPYGGWLAADLRAGETVLVTAEPPATTAARRWPWPWRWGRAASSHRDATRRCSPTWRAASGRDCAP